VTFGVEHSSIVSLTVGAAKGMCSVLYIAECCTAHDNKYYQVMGSFMKIGAVEGPTLLIRASNFCSHFPYLVSDAGGIRCRGYLNNCRSDMSFAKFDDR